MRKRWFLIAMMFLVIPWLIVGCGVPQVEYDSLKSTSAATQASLEKTTSDLTATKASLEQTQGVLTEREAEIDRLETRVDQLEKDLSMTKDTLVLWRSKYDELNIDYLEWLDKYLELNTDYQEFIGEMSNALTPPYTSIAEREIAWVFRLLDGSTERWTLDVDTYRYWIGRDEPTDTVTLNTDTGPVRMVDFTKYVKTSTFEDVLTSLYENSEDEYEFAREAFNIVAQLTVYSEDIGEDPRWPVETFTEGGGDCEDLAILYATFLKASPYPYEIELVYMDSDNPTDPQEINHVIVSVSGKDWRVLSECTNDNGFSDYWESVTGFYFKL